MGWMTKHGLTLPDGFVLQDVKCCKSYLFLLQEGHRLLTESASWLFWVPFHE
jgi:hypothetical protein